MRARHSLAQPSHLAKAPGAVDISRKPDMGHDLVKMKVQVRRRNLVNGLPLTWHVDCYA
jgi:hypothetical protein